MYDTQEPKESVEISHVGLVHIVFSKPQLENVRFRVLILI
jgi:hypothetical protein